MAQLTAKLTIGGQTYDASPAGIGKATFRIEREDGFVFYRKKIKGDLVFRNKDFKRIQTVENQACCQEIVIDIFRTCAGVTEHYFKGVFSLKEVAFDLDGCTATVKEIRTLDEYTCIFARWEKEVNILALATARNFTDYDGQLTYSRGRSLNQAIHYICIKMLEGSECVNATPASENDLGIFFNAPANPISKRSGATNRLLIVQASDMVNPSTGTAATKGELSFRKLTEELRAMFRVEWFVNPSTGRIQFEHESFFPQLSYGAATVGLDTTDGRLLSKNVRAYDYDFEKLYGEYILRNVPNEATAQNFLLEEPGFGGSIAQPTINDFLYGNIKFSDTCAQKDSKGEVQKKEVINNYFATDTRASRFNASQVDVRRWFYIIETEAGTGAVERIPLAVCERTNAYAENGWLAPTNLVKAYHRHNQSFPAGVMNYDSVFRPNGFYRGMASVMKVKRLKTLSVKYCCDDDALETNQRVKTWACAAAIVDGATYKPSSETLELDLLCDSRCNEIANEVIDDPTPGCPPRGEFIRHEESVDYCPDGVTPWLWGYSDIFADGRCGEYYVSWSSGTGGC